MGMDAKARVFYGYKHPIDKYGILNEDSELYEKYTNKGFRIVSNGGGYQHCLAVDNSYRYYDWDYGVQSINCAEMLDETINLNYHDTIKNFLDSQNIKYTEDDIGWFIICDFS